MTKHKIVLVPFPFDDLSSTKVRPAVCLTDSIGVHKHTILAFITSRVPDQPLPSDFVISITDKNFSATGLRVSSTFTTSPHDDGHNGNYSEGIGRIARRNASTS